MYLTGVVLFLFPLSLSQSLDRIVPRGVRLAKSALYDPQSEFTCFDGAPTIQFSQVNDDYCDCDDGSDEPGTSACPNGVFHCPNKGFVPMDIPSSRVIDGICDCCDGSDEYLTNDCSNNCEVLGLEAKHQAEKMAQLLAEGNQLRLQFAANGKRIKLQKTERLNQLEKEKLEAARIKEEAEKLKNVAEEAENAALEVYRVREEAEREVAAQKEREEMAKEASEAFAHLDSNNDGKLQIEEISTRQIFDKNKDGAVTDDETRFFFDDNTDIDEGFFRETVWPRLKPFQMREKGLFVPPQPEEPTEALEGQLEEEPEEEHENPEEDAGDGEEGEEHVDDDEDENHEEESEKESKSETQYDENTKRLIEEAKQARSHFDSAQQSLQDLDREINQLKDSLGKEFGADDEFAPLDGQCFTYEDREYTYKLCPFDQVVQIGRNGGSETRLGTWRGWADIEHQAMLYDKGQSCWNGPQRSTRVNVVCGLTNNIIKTTEPNKCEYAMEFETPAACRMDERVKEEHEHEEL